MHPLGLIHHRRYSLPVLLDYIALMILFARIHIFVLASLITYSITNLPISKTYSRHHYHDVVLVSLFYLRSYVKYNLVSDNL